MTKKQDVNTTILAGDVRQRAHKMGKFWLATGITSAVLGITAMTNTQTASAATLSTDSPAQAQDGTTAAAAQSNIQADQVKIQSPATQTPATTGAAQATTPAATTSTKTATPAPAPTNTTTTGTTANKATDEASDFDVSVNYTDKDGNAIADSDSGIYGSDDLQDNVDAKVQSLKDAGYQLVSDAYDETQTTTQLEGRSDGSHTAIEPTKGITKEDALNTVNSMLNQDLLAVNAKYGTSYHLYSNKVDSSSHTSLKWGDPVYPEINYYLITSENPKELDSITAGPAKEAASGIGRELISNSIYAAAARILSANGIATEVTLAAPEVYATDTWDSDSYGMPTFDPAKSYNLIFEKTPVKVVTKVGDPTVVTADKYYNNLTDTKTTTNKPDGNITTTTNPNTTTGTNGASTTNTTSTGTTTPSTTGTATVTPSTTPSTTATTTPATTSTTTGTTGTTGNATATTPANEAATPEATANANNETDNDGSNSTGLNLTGDSNEANDATNLENGASAANANDATTAKTNSSLAAPTHATKVSYNAAVAATSAQLPQTSETNSSILALTGVGLLGLLGLFGIDLKKRQN